MNCPEIILRFLNFFDWNIFTVFLILHMIPKLTFLIPAAHSNPKFTSLIANCYESVVQTLVYAPFCDRHNRRKTVPFFVLAFIYEYRHILKATIASFFLEDFEYVFEFFSFFKQGLK